MAEEELDYSEDTEGHPLTQHDPQTLPPGVTPEISKFIKRAILEASQSLPSTSKQGSEYFESIKPNPDDDSAVMEPADLSGGYSVVEDGEVVSPQCDFDDIVSNIFREHKPEENQFDDILDGVVLDLEIDKKGPGLSAKVAEVIGKMLKNKMSEDKIKEKAQKYLRPENCELLQSTRVNQLIWGKLRPTTRNRDVKLQKVQTLIIKGMIALGQGAQHILDAPGIDKSTVHEIFDALALMAQGNLELNLTRRELIKPDLHKDYQNLCCSDVPITSMLFGDDITKHLKELSETSKLGSKMSRGSGLRYRPYNQRGRYYRGRGRAPASSFLSQRGRSWGHVYKPRGANVKKT